MNLSGPLTTYERIEFPHAVRKAALKRANGCCEKCGTPFSDANPPEHDHRTEAWEGGDASLENCIVLGKKCCHQPKTASNTRRRKKADRQSREGHWLKKSKKKMDGSRDSKWKRKIGGGSVVREVDDADYMSADDDDIRDAMLFRFWCKAVEYPGGWPADTAAALKHCHTAEDYRKALTELARSKGVNLP